MSLTFKFLESYTKERFLSNLLSVLLYNNSRNGEFNTDYLNKFLTDMNGDINKYAPKDIIVDLQNIIKLSKDIISIKSDKSLPDVDYENIYEYFNNIKNNNFIKSIIYNLLESKKINSEIDFSKKYNDLIKEVSLFYQLKITDTTLSALNDFINKNYDNDDDIKSRISEFKEIIERSYHSINESSLLTSNDLNSELWYYDDDEVENTVKETVDYLGEDFVIMKTGIPVVDDNIYGLMSGKTYVICAPSNHGKSLLLQNFAYNVIKNNPDMFSGEKDVVLLWLAEDDKFNGQKRAISIYGGYDPNLISDIHFYLPLNRKNKNKHSLNEFSLLFKDILKESITSVTKGKTRLGIKQSEEGTTSASDIVRRIEELKYQGYNVKCVFVDYIEALIPSMSRSKGDDYVDQGTIVKELRGISRAYSIPVVTASQLQRYADDDSSELKNSLIGDSKKKVDYADYIIMLRQMRNMDPLSENVQRFVNKNYKQKDNDGISLLDNNNDGKSKNLIPVQIAITKSKDGKLSGTSYVLICSNNLRILSDYNDALKQIKQSEDKTDKLRKRFNDMVKQFEHGKTIQMDKSYINDLI